MTTRTGDDGVHDPAQRPTEPLNGETPEEREARVNEPSERKVEAEQQERAAKRKGAEGDEPAKHEAGTERQKRAVKEEGGQ